MYFFAMLLAAVYWIIYGNWIGGCLLASLFLILIYSIGKCKKEEQQVKFKVHMHDFVIGQGENIKADLEVFNVTSKKDGYIFEIKYEIESKFHEEKSKKKKKIRWDPAHGYSDFLTETISECDNYILRLKSITWEDLTGIYKAKQELDQEIYFLVMPVSYELGTMKNKLQSIDAAEQGFEYDGVRNYHEGDKLSRIHWNLYASTRQLWVRKNEDDVDETIKIGLDLSEIKKEQFSDYFSIFYSISLFYMEAGIYQEIYYGMHKFLLKNIEQYEELFTDIFNEGRQKIVNKIPGIYEIKLNNEEQNIQDYLYDMEL